MNKTTHPYFVADGDSRQDTAILLVGTAREFGIPQRDIAAVRGGFRISQALADVLYDEGQDEPEPVQPDPEPEPEPEPEPVKTSTTSTKSRTTKKTAAKRTSTSNEE
jgi:hypothetical protein